MNPLLAELRAICPAPLFNELAALPRGFALRRIAYYRASESVAEARRADFSKVSRAAFLRRLARDHAPELAVMGLSAAAIDRMAQTGDMPRNHPGEQLDCTVDHVLSLHLGGKNDFDNLALVPARINDLKNRLEKLQASSAPQGEIITIVPEPPSRVPHVEGGFTRAKALAL